MNELINSLNDQQMQVLNKASDSLNVLVTAGAGAGKSRTLIARTLKLLNEGVNPQKICIITFTNKAASELRERLKAQTNQWFKVTVGTFHHVCLKILTDHGHNIGFKSFTIASRYECYKLVSEILKLYNVDNSKENINEMLGYMSSKKNDLILPKAAIASAANDTDLKLATMYKEYQDTLKANQKMDFDDLIVYCFILLVTFKDIRKQIEYDYIMIDEAQDSNTSQINLSTVLSSKNRLYVGDIRQSIYGWRGAKPDYFGKEWTDEVMHLTTNYRSTKNIVEGANDIISKSTIHLYNCPEISTPNELGEKIKLHSSFSIKDEANWVVNEIKHLQHTGIKLNDIAILYRTSAQTRLMEYALNNYGIKYKIFGGLSFIDRAEIKDICCFLKVLVNKKDDDAIVRALGTLPGIGKVTINKLQKQAQENGTTLIKEIMNYKGSRRNVETLTDFINLLTEISPKNGNSLIDTVTKLIAETKMIEKYKNSKNPDDEMRIDNINEFIKMTNEFIAVNKNATLVEFVNHINLHTEKDTEDEKNCVNMLTLHSSKGLEFKVVFIISCVDGVLPHKLSKYDREKLEEERRLMYVGMTRAEKLLYLTSYKESFSVISEFVNQIHPSRKETVY